MVLCLHLEGVCIIDIDKPSYRINTHNADERGFPEVVDLGVSAGGRKMAI